MQEQLDRLDREYDILHRQLETRFETPEGRALAVQQAKRLRRETQALIQALARDRDRRSR